MTTRVLMLEPGGWGGICHYSYNLCKALSSDAVSVRLLTAEPYELQDLPHNFDVTTRFDANTPYKTKLKEVIKSYRAYRPDVIHIQSTFSARKDWFALAMCKMLNVPIVYTAHNILPHDADEKDARGMKWAYGKLYAYSSHIIAHSEDSRVALTNLFAPPPQKVSVIPHGNYVFAESETPRTKNTSRQHLKLNTDKRYLLAFGTIRPYKGTEDLLEAFAHIAHRFPDVDTLIAGKPIGQSPQELIDHINKLGLQDRVIFRPDYIALEDIAHYFEACDIAVYPYHAIYQSGALQLAYAFARPVVATAVGAFPETVDDGQNGILVPTKDPEQFAQALTKMLSAPQTQLDAMGKHSRHLADTRYAWTSVAEKTTAIYKKLAAH
ncbi:MAG: glycosyltransferase family 4 protein [Candidatus Latescibacteria bacterium]|nr:glycosyltransferase family 4 protein [Candidatus Latescibacterota bacterium]